MVARQLLSPTAQSPTPITFESFLGSPRSQEATCPSPLHEESLFFMLRRKTPCPWLPGSGRSWLALEQCFGAGNNRVLRLIRCLGLKYQGLLAEHACAARTRASCFFSRLTLVFAVDFGSYASDVAVGANHSTNASFGQLL